MSEGSMEEVISLLEAISRSVSAGVSGVDIKRELSPVLEELRGIREELVKLNKVMGKIQFSAEKIEEKYRWARIGS